MSEPVPPVAPAQTMVLDQPQPIFEQPYKPCCDPCPCITLQSGVRIIAFLEMIFQSNILGGLIVGTTVLVVVKSRVDKIILTYLIMSIFIVFGLLILAFLLYVGATKRNRWKCAVYFIGRSIIEIILIIILIVFVAIEVSKKSVISLTLYDYAVIAALSILILIGVYVLFVVYIFMEQVKFHPNRPVYLIPDEQVQPGVVRPLPSASSVL